MPQRTPLSIPTIALALTGCATGGGGKFACPHPEGVTCLSPVAIYRATDDRRHLESVPAGHTRDSGRNAMADDDRRPRRDEQRRGDDEPGYRIDADGLRLVDPSERKAAVEFAPESSPYRTASRVMRIWIAPWEDEDGDLHVGARVYTEIEGRRWLVAEPHARPRGSQVMHLVSAPATARTEPAAGAAPTRPQAPASPAGDSTTGAAGRK